LKVLDGLCEDTKKGTGILKKTMPYSSNNNHDISKWRYTFLTYINN